MPAASFPRGEPDACVVHTGVVAISHKEAARADVEANLIKLKTETMVKMTENMETMETLKDLHLDCDSLLQNSKSARKLMQVSAMP